MKLIMYLVAAAAFFGILAWFIERRRGKPFEAEGDARVPFSYADQEQIRIEGQISAHSDHRH